MPEFLENGGFYFNSKSIDSIEEALKQLLQNSEAREEMAKNNIDRAKKYSWTKTSNQTFEFITEVYKNYKNV